MQTTIAFITDTHLGDKTPGLFGIDARHNLQLVLNDIAQHNVESLVFGGDITETSEYEWFFNRLENFNPGFRAIMGNHDTYAEAAKYYKQPSADKNALYYSFEDSTYKYIYLDSSSSKIDDVQCAWFKNQISCSKKIIVFIHHPVLGFSTGMDAIYPLKNREAVEAILQQAPNEVYIFCGHYHMPDVCRRGNVTQYTTLATSFQVKKEASAIEIYSGTFGYRLITVTKHSVNTQLFLYVNGSFEATEG
ncbi:MAG: metallophosphoesterase [Bacteroidota bacterium]